MPIQKSILTRVQQLKRVLFYTNNFVLERHSPFPACKVKKILVGPVIIHQKDRHTNNNVKVLFVWNLEAHQKYAIFHKRLMISCPKHNHFLTV